MVCLQKGTKIKEKLSDGEGEGMWTCNKVVEQKVSVCPGGYLRRFEP